MWSTVVPSKHLYAAPRWTAAYFQPGDIKSSAGYPMHPLGKLCRERRGSSDPQQLGETEITYLGLENIRPLTGELVDFQQRPASAIKSRSKIFKEGDVLYGRLRPELNKVFLASPPAAEGLCSGEFIVLIPNTDVVLPRLLRHLLASNYVTQLASRLRAGASLPRMAAEDLLKIELPVPPMKVQRKLVRELEKIDEEIEVTRQRLTQLPAGAALALRNCLERGQQSLEWESS